MKEFQKTGEVFSFFCFPLLLLAKKEKQKNCFKKGIVCRIQSNTGGIAENAQAITYPRERNSANYLRIFGRSKPIFKK